jgi:NADPH-dependent glutamate synthase beta subunit-like oxidoreductase
VEIRDATADPGGMMHYGIPAYRLPREGVDREIARIEAMGVKIVRNARVNDVLAEKAAGSFDAVFLGIGAQVANHLDIPAMDGGKIIDAVTLLERLEKDRAPSLGRVVGIIGRANTAMDASRTAKRLGAEEAVLIFRFDKAQMGSGHFTSSLRPHSAPATSRSHNRRIGFAYLTEAAGFNPSVGPFRNFNVPPAPGFVSSLLPLSRT